MKWLISIPLALILVSPSCERFHFKTGIVEITNARGDRTMHSQFHDGEIGKIGRGYIFRAQLPDGGTIMIESSERPEPEEKK